MDKQEVVELLYLGLANSHRCNEPCVDCMEAAELLYEEHFRLPIGTMCPSCDTKLNVGITKGGYIKTQAVSPGILRVAKSRDDAEEKFQQEKNRRINQMMNKQKITESMLGWLIMARDSSDNSDASLRQAAKTMYYEFFSHTKPTEDLGEIRSALGLPDDTSEPLVGLIWRLQQRIEDLEESVEISEVPNICGEILGDFICNEIKGHKGHHVGVCLTNPSRRASWRYID